jgi:hypothetical protein
MNGSNSWGRRPFAFSDICTAAAALEVCLNNATGTGDNSKQSNATVVDSRFQCFSTFLLMMVQKPCCRQMSHSTSCANTALFHSWIWSTAIIRVNEGEIKKTN